MMTSPNERVIKNRLYVMKAFKERRTYVFQYLVNRPLGTRCLVGIETTLVQRLTVESALIQY